MIKLSNTAKMQITGKRTRSWSLEAGVTCPGSHTAEVCKGCYAKKGMYRFPVVKGTRQSNRIDYKTPDWVARMVKELTKLDYMRWFDSGDLESTALATKIEEVIKLTPNVTHWLPTRSDKIKSIKTVVDRIKTLPNVAVRLSADNIGLTKLERTGVNSYVIRPEDIPKAELLGITVCPVTTDANKKSCGDCTLCYTDASVAYLVH